ncbi:WD repeat-containing protein 37 [Neocloeon triangulifer]|uniref:WD repeat-containing protein 37 n=1 Tax=Neocloeon triangulifer TaxID=2078957 RepID=UPI00286F32CC|nr:WD repeat-containing protein 37 [Neocloeon triangulifer]
MQEPPALPPAIRTKLHSLFSEIEKEFELLYLENLQLQGRASGSWDAGSLQVSEKASAIGDTAELDGLRQKKQKVSQQSSLQRVKAATKLKAQTSKIVSSFKGALITTSFVREFPGHRDGVWDVSCPRSGQPFLGTASADHTAGVWNTTSGACVLKYTGHSGSVNSIRFHPSRDMVLTASGDTTAHIWQADMGHQPLVEPDPEDKDSVDDKTEAPALRTPRFELKGHTNVVIAADWLSAGDQVITASWDRTASLYDANTGESLQSLTGHDQELTHIHAHPSQPLVVTSSKDCTFRLWDFRESIHSVSVFQGHTESVTCAVFTHEDKVVSGSDDRTAKVWDLRNMRSPLVTIRNDSSVNRVAVSSSGTIAIPSDNRQVRFFDLEGQRLGRLARSGRQGHRRMVCSVAWADEPAINFYTAGFDRLVLGWSVQPCKDLVSR